MCVHAMTCVLLLYIILIFSLPSTVVAIRSDYLLYTYDLIGYISM